MLIPPQITLQRHQNNSDACTANVSMYTVVLSEIPSMLRLAGLHAGASSEPEKEKA